MDRASKIIRFSLAVSAKFQVLQSHMRWAYRSSQQNYGNNCITNNLLAIGMCAWCSFVRSSYGKLRILLENLVVLCRGHVCHSEGAFMLQVTFRASVKQTLMNSASMGESWPIMRGNASGYEIPEWSSLMWISQPHTDEKKSLLPSIQDRVKMQRVNTKTWNQERKNKLCMGDVFNFLWKYLKILTQHLWLLD